MLLTRKARLHSQAVRRGVASRSFGLDLQTRQVLARGFGRDVGDVRLHVGPEAARAAAALRAAAFTVGRDVVFGAGRYPAARGRGLRLLAHEVAHVLQQEPGPISTATAGVATEGAEAEASRAGERIARGEHHPLVGARTPPVVARQPEAEPVHFDVGRSRLTLIPGTGPLSIEGMRFPLPASLRLTNAFGAGPGPTFIADLDPSGLILNILGTVDLHTTPVAGTPAGRAPDPENVERIQLVSPMARLDFRSGGIEGRATLHVPSGYPARLHPGTDIAVHIASRVAEPMRWRVGASYGPLSADATVNLRYDLGSLAAALLTGSSTPSEALAAPGLSVRGTGRLFGVPVTGFGLDAPTTRPRSEPLLGAPTPFPSRLYAGGVIVAPAGSVTSVAAPALGITGASFGARSGVSGTAALLPTLSPSAISAGGPLSAQFPVNAYAEVSYVRRVSSGLEVGVRAILQVNSADLFNPPTGLPEPVPPGREPVEPTGVPPPLPQPISPFGGVTIHGRFNAL